MTLLCHFLNRELHFFILDWALQIMQPGLSRGIWGAYGRRGCLIVVQPALSTGSKCGQFTWIFVGTSSELACLRCIL